MWRTLPSLCLQPKILLSFSCFKLSISVGVEALPHRQYQYLTSCTHSPNTIIPLTMLVLKVTRDKLQINRPRMLKQLSKHHNRSLVTHSQNPR